MIGLVAEWLASLRRVHDDGAAIGLRLYDEPQPGVGGGGERSKKSAQVIRAGWVLFGAAFVALVPYADTVNHGFAPSRFIESSILVAGAAGLLLIGVGFIWRIVLHVRERRQG